MPPANIVKSRVGIPDSPRRLTVFTESEVAVRAIRPFDDRMFEFWNNTKTMVGTM
jgi:hypothetical protein